MWCPDWPVIAAGITEGRDVHAPGGGRRTPTGCWPARRRPGPRASGGAAQARGAEPLPGTWWWCDHDPGRDARAFEPVVAAVEELAPGVEVVRPGCLRARRPGAGPATTAVRPRRRRRMVEHVAQRCVRWRARSGSPTVSSRAMLAARAGRIVAPAARPPTFLAGMSMSSTRTARASSTCCARLGISTLAEFAAAGARLTCWPGSASTPRYAPPAAAAGRAALASPQAAARPGDGRRGLRRRRWNGSTWPPSPREGRWPSGCTNGWPGTGWPATRLGIEALTEAGEELHRVWRHDGLLDDRRASPTGCAGSSTAGSPAPDRAQRWARPRRPDRRRASTGCAWSPTGCCRYAGMQPGPVGRRVAARRSGRTAR